MVLAGVYGVGELVGAGWVGVHGMVVSHGLLNALGFTLCGILGQLCWERQLRTTRAARRHPTSKLASSAWR